MVRMRSRVQAPFVAPFCFLSNSPFLWADFCFLKFSPKEKGRFWKICRAGALNFSKRRECAISSFRRREKLRSNLTKSLYRSRQLRVDSLLRPRNRWFQPAQPSNRTWFLILRLFSIISPPYYRFSKVLPAKSIFCGILLAKIV